ncbi:MAG TPA: hypothetical protein VHY75_04370 [Steroidobacteraceae bacterium]|nr:hypothetical protein [Steroidobacteraceae bacterium]
MTDHNKMTTRFAALAAALGMAYFAAQAAAQSNDAPPPASSPPGGEAPQGRHHNPAWAACKKQADDQKLAPGDARHEFMKSCMKSAKDAAPPPASS